MDYHEHVVKDVLAGPAVLRTAGPSGRLTRILLGAGAVGLAGLILVLLVFFYGGERPSSSAPAKAPGSPEVQTGAASVQAMKPLRREIVRSVTLPANISPWYQTTLYAKVPGYLKWIGFDKGDQVKAGQLLAVIDAPEIKDHYEQAKADYTIKKITADRYLSVWKENPDMIAKQDVDMAQAAAEGAKQAMASQHKLLGYTEVRAPFSGVITARFADPGALIQAATGSVSQAAPLFTIMDLKTVRIYVNVPQESAYRAKPGVPGKLTLRELPGQTFTGTITRTTNALDPATRTLLIEIDLPNAERLLQPGMFGDVTLSLERHPNAIAIPPSAIIPGKGTTGPSVFIVDGGKARKVPIKTGIDDGIWVEVIEGLSGEEQVVVVGKGTLVEGTPVESQPYTLPSGTPARQKL